MRRRLYLVEMINHIDRQDDEVWKVRASSKPAAKVLAQDGASRYVVVHVPIGCLRANSERTVRERSSCMNSFQIGAWIDKHDPQRYMTRVQHEIIVSCLQRDDVDKAKKMLVDWKIPQEPYEPR